MFMGGLLSKEVVVCKRDVVNHWIEGGLREMAPCKVGVRAVLLTIGIYYCVDHWWPMG